MAHGILWEGASHVNGARIVAIATTDSDNPKTADMDQVWILLADIDPWVAVKLGLDLAVCGHCPHRGTATVNAAGDPTVIGRSCYVRAWQAPLSVWRAYKAGSYERVQPTDFAGRKIRWGAYGDPSLLPPELVSACNAVADGHTGYTHQWKADFAQAFRGTFMASADSPAGEKAARALGWGTFRAGLQDGSDKGRATLCAAERLGQSCADCMKCDGGARAIYIPAHGSGAGHAPAERVRRRLSVVA